MAIDCIMSSLIAEQQGLLSSTQVSRPLLVQINRRSAQSGGKSQVFSSGVPADGLVAPAVLSARAALLDQGNHFGNIQEGVPPVLSPPSYPPSLPSFSPSPLTPLVPLTLPPSLRTFPSAPLQSTVLFPPSFSSLLKLPPSLPPAPSVAIVSRCLHRLQARDEITVHRDGLLRAPLPMGMGKCAYVENISDAEIDKGTRQRGAGGWVGQVEAPLIRSSFMVPPAAPDACICRMMTPHTPDGHLLIPNPPSP